MTWAEIDKSKRPVLMCMRYADVTEEHKRSNPYWSSNVTGFCEICLNKITYRPHKPPKAVTVCNQCVVEHFKQTGEVGEVKLTDETVLELGALTEKKKNH